MATAGRGGRGGGEDYKSAAVDQGSEKSEKDIVRMREREGDEAEKGGVPQRGV